MARNDEQLQAHYFRELAARICGDGGHYLDRFGSEITMKRMENFVSEHSKMKYLLSRHDENKPCDCGSGKKFKDCCGEI